MSAACAAGRCWECAGCNHWCHSKVAMEWCLHRCAYCGELFRPTELTHEGTVLRGGSCPRVCDSGPHETTPIISDDDRYSITPEGLEALDAP